MKVNLNRPICFFDLETTGAKVGKDRIVEMFNFIELKGESFR